MPWAMPKISAYIIAFNEAAKIEAAVSSVLWADEIVVADSNSTDGTAALAEALGARVVQVPFTGFGELRNRAVEACRHEWIFSLDSDERCTAGTRRDPRADRERARARCLHGAAPVLHDGTLDQRLGLVSELPPAAALSQGRDALQARSGSRRLRASDREAARPSAKRDSAVSPSAIWKRSSRR